MFSVLYGTFQRNAAPTMAPPMREPPWRGRQRIAVSTPSRPRAMGGGMGDGGGVRMGMAMWGMGLGVGGVQGWRGGRGEGSVTAEYSTPAKHAALGTHSGCLRSLFSE